MKLVQVDDARSPGFREFWLIYESSFPSDERRSLEQQESTLLNQAYRLIAAYENEILVGFISYWDLEGFSFIEHVAVREHLRDRGAGTRLLHLFLSGRSKVILETEPPETELQKRRISFYKRMGFRTNAFPYLQPPYGSGKSAVRMIILSYPKALSEEEFESIREKLHKEVYGLAAPLI